MRKKALLLPAAVIGLAGLYLNAMRPAPIGPKREKLGSRLYAHRGLHSGDGEVPENSLAAFALAAANGYGAELDVNLDGDGNVVVFHDDTLKRMTGVSGRLNDTPAAERRRLRLCGGEQRIPLLKEVLTVADGIPLIVELKSTPRYRELCRKTLALLGGYGGDYVVESFDPRIVAWFRRNAPHIVRGQLVCRYSEKSLPCAFARFAAEQLLTNAAARPHFIACEQQMLRSPPVRFCKAAGAAVVVWTARTLEETRRAASADAVIFEAHRPRNQRRA